MQPLTKLGCPEPLVVVYLYTKKVGKAPKSAYGVCPGQLQGVCAVRPEVLTRLSKMEKRSAGPRVDP